MKLRKVTYRLYPNVAQARRLTELLELHQRLYNTALEDRLAAYREDKATLSYVAQAKALTQWRKRSPALAGMNAQSQQVTLKRVELAFQAFFRRLKAGEKAGFPRFKTVQRFSGWGYATHGDGWKLHAGEKLKHGFVRLSSAGKIPLRGKSRTEGKPKTAEVLHKSGRWYLSVSLECEPERMGGTKAIGMDWGLENFVTLCTHEGKTESISNPRFLNKAQRQKIKTLQQLVSRKTNQRSHNRRKAVNKLSIECRRIANRRKDFLYQTSAKIVKNYGLIATEKLDIKNMTAKGGTYKKGLNRRVLDTAPSTFISLLKAKAEEAGSLWIEVPTRLVKPSQSCHRCGIQRKKSLSQRAHRCDCGASCSRDENAARVMLNWTLFGNVTGQELSEVGSLRCLGASNHETPTITA